MLTILLFVLVLGVLVLVHELGHFWAAKKSGCAVDEFGIGFPPRLFSFKRNETVYSINLLPLGGYVKIRGENGDDHPDEKSFVTKSTAWKALIVSAGVLMNVALAYVLITANLIAGVSTTVSDGENFGRFARLGEREIAIVEVLPGSPAAQADIKPGDIIRSVDQAPAETLDAVMQRFGATEAKPIALELTRGEEYLSKTIKPTRLEELGRSGVGVGLAQTAELSYPWYVAPWYGLVRTLTLLWLIIAAFGGLIAQLFSSGSVSADVTGPIGIAVLTGQVAKLGFWYLMQFAALLSLNLAIINILPFPALDGSRLLLIIIEKIRGKQLNVHLERWAHVIGFGLLMLLMVVVTARDLKTYGGGIWHAITSLFT
ncbi:MAG: site-2 protease family protein [Parcubacteria group bacterium]|nr:site-2 protease family protein [Parcubacteria group bacterium]